VLFRNPDHRAWFRTSGSKMTVALSGLEWTSICPQNRETGSGDSDAECDAPPGNREFEKLRAAIVMTLTC